MGSAKRARGYGGIFMNTAGGHNVQNTGRFVMRYLKFACYGLGALVVVVGAVFAYVAATFDPNDYKDEITRLAREKTGRLLTIQGDIRLTFFPKIGVSLGKTSLSERGTSEEFAGVDDLRVSLALFPLLSKRIVVDAVLIDGLRARLVRRRDGTTNIDDLIAGGEQDPSPELKSTDSTSSPAATLDIEAVRVRQATFVWNDERTGSEYTISDMTLTAGRVAPGVPTAFEFGATVISNQPTLDLTTKLAGTLDADLERQIFRLTQLRAEASGVAAAITGLTATLSGDVEARTASHRFVLRTVRFDGSGAIGSDRFSTQLETPSIVLDQGTLSVEALVAALSGNLAGVELSQSRLAAPKVRVDLDRQLLEVERLELNASGKRDADRFDLKVDAPQLSITPEKATGAAVSAVLKAQGPQLAADARLRFSAIEGSAKALKVAELRLDLDAKQAQNAIKGHASTPVAANLESQVFELPKIAGKFDLRSPALPTKSSIVSFTGKAIADVKREDVSADLKARFDESNIQAKGGMKRFAQPQYQFDVAIDTLNVDRYTVPKPEKTGAAPAQGEQKETPFDLSALKELNLNGTVRIGELIASNVKASNVRIDVKAANGKVEINPLSANLYQGSVDSVIGIDANQNRFAVKQNLTGVFVGPLLRDALAKDLLEGRGDIGLDVTAAGTTVGALLRTLAGSAKLGLKDGAIKGINLAQSLRGAKNMLATKSAQDSVASSSEKTDFSELAASFTIKNGKARNDDLSVKSPFLRLAGAGEIDLAEGGLNYLAKASIVSTSTGQAGKDLADVAGLTIPVRVSGPVNALKYRLEFGNAVADRSKQKIEEKKEALKTKLESQLQEKLLGASKPVAPASPQDEGQPGPDGAQESPAAPKPQDQVKKRLKDLIR